MMSEKRAGSGNHVHACCQDFVVGSVQGLSLEGNVLHARELNWSARSMVRVDHRCDTEKTVRPLSAGRRERAPSTWSHRMSAGIIM
jgi:hypothetical protein